VGLPDLDLAKYETAAVAARPEAHEAKHAVTIAEDQAAQAHGNLLPQVALHGAFEADRQRFYNRAGANWVVSLGLHWNLFNGFGGKARIAESESLVERSKAQEEQTGSGIRLQVRRAYADLRAAERRIEVAQASVDEAQESLRITQNRYGVGLANVTDLLRTETAVLNTKTHYLAALHDQRLAAAALDMAAGNLTVDSPVLN
jgi:outer membrane protein TolC